MKSQPGKLAYSSAGTGNGSHLTVELFRAAAGELDMVHVPYKGGATQERLAKMGLVVVASPQSGLTERLQRDVPKWGKAVKDSGAVAE